MHVDEAGNHLERAVGCLGFLRARQLPAYGIAPGCVPPQVVCETGQYRRLAIEKAFDNVLVGERRHEFRQMQHADAGQRFHIAGVVVLQTCRDCRDRFLQRIDA
ncbi:hypothetical protein [Paraburkholderia ferrariae]|uniref:hypothetical protein n=1 Tax=Paraburkholderia ferrariae TaxID=386056 RepID=UPI001FE09928|nr:hypothetical protein [Paraburkholderia ferrariae]